jgi:uncharacterized Zn finger protein
MSWFSYAPYVSVAERRRNAEQAAKKMAAKGQVLAPIKLDGRSIANTFWGKAWCDNLEAYSDYANRLPRGRTYVRNGSVIDLQIGVGKVMALVYGSELYKITIKIDPLDEARWTQFKKGAAGKVTNLLDLLQGKLSKDILADISAKGSGLFPSPKEIKLDCSCPDWADMCKHVAAVLYGVGARLDDKPELFFTLRGVNMEELISAASESAATPVKGKAKKSALAGADLSAIFGVEIEDAEGVANVAKTPVASKKKRALSKRDKTKAKSTKKKTVPKSKVVRTKRRVGKP